MLFCWFLLYKFRSFLAFTFPRAGLSKWHPADHIQPKKGYSVALAFPPICYCFHYSGCGGCGWGVSGAGQHEGRHSLFSLLPVQQHQKLGLGQGGHGRGITSAVVAVAVGSPWYLCGHGVTCGGGPREPMQPGAHDLNSPQLL